MSIADKYRPQFTYEDYCLWEGRWELIDGMPYAISPSSAREHQMINGNLYSIFDSYLKKSCSKCRTYMPLDWKINAKTVVQPDLMVVCNDFSTIHLEFAPSLVVEILSTSTAYKDRHEKFELYEMEGVKYYLIVDPKFKKIEIYQLIDKKYQPVAVTPDSFEFSFDNGCDEPVNIHFTGVWD